MTHYNSVERNIAKLLAQFPFLKKIIKQLYSKIIFFMNKKNYLKKTDLSIQQFDDRNESFFGYYDKHPVNHDGKYIIYHISSYPTYSKPNPLIPIKVTVQNVFNGKILLQIPSLAYNWQQGCRTQWLNNDLFIFNDFDISNNKYISMVWSVSSLKEEKRFKYPVQDAYQTDYFLSLKYRRLMTLRPDYGYRNLPLLDKTELMDIENDGIWKVDYQSGNEKLLVRLSAISAIKPDKKMESAFHKVNHVMISPAGKQFIFLHRYYLEKRRFDRLFLADVTSGELKLLADYGMVSHCFWADNKTILGYLRGPNGKDAYWLIDIEMGKFTHALDGKLDNFSDGHPHVHGDWFVTDTYPDKARMQHLLLVNWKTGEIKELGEFFHSFKYFDETRCDLHPRFSSDDKAIYFDSVFSGKRQFYRMEII
jgi:hypothetical protein